MIEEPEAVIFSPTGLNREFLDVDALRSVQRLQDRGYEAYLVGGCVRDLLLGRHPKDFDIATSARPQHVKRTFPRNCRIIGRRFKLAHLHFNQNQKILEVSTFRRQPEEEEGEDGDLLITTDNEFGTAAEDAVRRDFTINALFYDPVSDSIHDYCGGMADIDARLLHTIGDPVTRFREDPVRILRAAKFSGRLGLKIDDDTYDAMRIVAPDLTRSAPPRLLEEVLRLLRGTHALDSFQILRDIGALKAILPEIDEFLETAPYEVRVKFWRTLETLDGVIQNGANDLSNGLLLGALYVHPVQHLADQDPDLSPSTIAEEFITPLATELRLPRRDTGCLKRICGVQSRFTTHGRKRFKISAFLRDQFFEDAFRLFELSAVATGTNTEDLARWRDIVAEENGFVDRAGEERAREEQGSLRQTARKTDDRERRQKKSPQKKSRSDRGRSEKARPERERPERQRPERQRPERKKPDRQRPDRQRPDKQRSGKSRTIKVSTIEPEAIDVSAFDVELDPKRVPTFSSILEGSKKKKKRHMVTPEEDTYKPPPPPGGDGPAAPPPPPPPDKDDDVFGDW